MASAAKRIPENILSMLADLVTFENSRAYIAEKLDRPDYLAINQALVAIGGKWDKKAKAHLFPPSTNPEASFAELLETGLCPTRNPLSFFPTPKAVADRCRTIITPWLGRRTPGTIRCLEPSCGDGSLVVRTFGESMPDDLWWTLVEPDRDRLAAAKSLFEERIVEATCGDFLSQKQRSAFDLVLMNPPFSTPGKASAWAEHVLHAAKMLSPGGLLVAILPSSVTFRSDKLAVAVRDLFARSAPRPSNAIASPPSNILELPQGSFKESGTEVNTTVCYYDAPRS